MRPKALAKPEDFRFRPFGPYCHAQALRHRRPLLPASKTIRPSHRHVERARLPASASTGRSRARTSTTASLPSGSPIAGSFRGLNNPSPALTCWQRSCSARGPTSGSPTARQRADARTSATRPPLRRLAELRVATEILGRTVLPTTIRLAEDHGVVEGWIGPNKHWLSRLPGRVISWRYSEPAVAYLANAPGDVERELALLAA